MENRNIDNGKSFDFGKTSADYAKYRDIYPQKFYSEIHNLGICTENQKVLDLGTGTGVLPRNMYHYGADFTGIDIAENQIKQAEKLSEGMNIKYFCTPVEKADFKPDSFDAVTACQCFFYFDHEVLAPKLAEILKPHGKFAVMCMEWLPFEDKVAKATEDLILKYNPDWNGCNETRHNIYIPEVYNEYFDLETSIIYDIKVPFTAESWNGRIKTCRGIGASLPEEKIAEFEQEHLKMLREITSENFEILHYCAVAVLSKK